MLRLFPRSLLRDRSQIHHFVPLVLLVFAGEIIFALPFHIPRYFRPGFLDVFALSNSELGDIFAFYGVTAMICYFPGGPLADRFSARKLMSAALLATAVGGLLLLTGPDAEGIRWLFAYWGITTILLFWAAMIKAARQIGGEHTQGIAFGLLDGGRGLVAATAASVAVALFAYLLPVTLVSDTSSSSGDTRRNALQAVIIYYSLLTAVAGILIYRYFPEDTGSQHWRNPHPLSSALRLLINPRIWLQGVVVVCAYCGYKGLDNYGLYAFQILQLSEVDAAAFTAAAAFLRPVAAIAAGLLADRFQPSRVITLAFGLAAASYGLMLLSPAYTGISLMIANLSISAAAMFAIRGIYFALIHECQMPRNATGVAVGTISMLGFTPDIFFAPLAGRLLDRAPGVAGYHAYFLLLGAFAIIGIAASMALRVLNARNESVNREA